MKNLNLTNDFVFKKVFGKKGNESILKDLLEAILKIKIKKIELQTEVELERELIDDKTGVLDIEATIDDNTIIKIIPIINHIAKVLMLFFKINSSYLFLFINYYV